MRYRVIKTGIVLLGAAFLCLFSTGLFAQESKEAGLAAFFNEPRPAAQFDHLLHEEATGGDESCAKCHHVFDEQQNRLVYSEGEEDLCFECHLQNKENNIPALREASHKSCTGCHRTLKKSKQPAGPTTCGECHKK